MSEKKITDLSSNRMRSKKKLLSMPNIFIAVVLFILAGLLFSQIGPSWDKAQQQQRQLHTQQAEQILSEIVRAAAIELNKTAGIINDALHTQLNSNDFNKKSWQDAFKSDLSARLGEQVEIHYLPRDYNPDKIIDHPGQGYVILSLLNDIKQNDRVDVEVHHAASKQDNIVLVRKVKDPTQGHEAGGETIGFIVFSISTRLFNNFASYFNPQQGYIEVIQKSASGNMPLVLMAKGDKSLKGSDLSVIEKVSNSRWSFKFWPALADDGFSWNSYWQALVYAVLALLSLIAALIISYKTVTKYRKAQYVTVPERQISPFSQQNQTASTEVNDDIIKDAVNTIFGSYDIRGVVGEQVNVEVFKKIAFGLALEAHEKQQHSIAVACDGRNSSPELVSALIDGLRQSGINVLDLGMVPTPVLYFAAITKCSGNGVMVTASHNPANYNGMKIMLAGHFYSGVELQGIKEKVLAAEFMPAEGSVKIYNIIEDYISKITANIILARPMNIVIDTANGAAGVIAQTLFEQLGCNVVMLFAEVDGDFPNHPPDPSQPENLAALRNAVTEHKADIGFAFDGDGDRLGIVSSGGEIVWPDRVLMLLAKDILSRNKGATILYDVKSSKKLSRFISQRGGKSVMCPSGHSLMKKKLLETGALLAGEMSGHLYIKERWFGFDDALFAAARVLEILSIDLRKSRQVFAELPDSLNTPEILLPVENPHVIMHSLLADTSAFNDAKVFTIDGLRAEYNHGWGLVRASNTADNLSLRFEADDEQALQDIAQTFKQAVLKVAPQIEFPF